jgi:hypothetical protein
MSSKIERHLGDRNLMPWPDDAPSKSVSVIPADPRDPSERRRASLVNLVTSLREPLLEGIRAKISRTELCATAGPDGEAARVASRAGPQRKLPQAGDRPPR